MSGTKLFGTVIVFLEEFFEKLDFEKKISVDDKKNMTNFPGGKVLNCDT